MTDPIPTNREHENDHEVEELVRKLLPPIVMQPYDQHGLVPDAMAALIQAETSAIRYKNSLSTSFADIPDQTVKKAVIANFEARFYGASASLEEYFEANQFSPSARYMYGLHDHTTPEQALIFFLEQDGLPSIDVAAALCTDESRNITSEILDRTKSHFRSAEEVYDAMPEVDYWCEDIVEEDARVVFSIGKDVFKVKGSILKRRKTYIAPLEWANENRANFQELFLGNRQTPDVVYPVIESIYATRKTEKRSSYARYVLDMALDNIDGDE